MWGHADQRHLTRFLEEDMLSRRSFLAISSLVASSIALKPKKAKALQDPSLVSLSAIRYIQQENRDGEGWVTMVLNDAGDIVEVERFDYLSLDNVGGAPRSGVAVSIAVYVGTALAGYVIGTVVDGIIISATGQSGAVWVSQAINRLVGRPVPASRSIRLSCDVYPPNSMEYIRCIRS